MSGNAWVTLATNDSYALGTLVLASSLRAVGTAHQIAVMVTRGVSSEMKERLRAAFDMLFEVNVLDSQDEVNLALLSRPELGLTFTKLHCWRLTQFQKCVFLDADTMVVQNCDELFDREELSAAPDAGWPDCFNSGVFVYRPSVETFKALLTFAVTHGSFDGGDQGLLNSFFSDWATKDIAFHLPFIYNMCSNAVYSYLPAYKKYGDTVKIVHFIGPNKPWLMHFDVETGCVHPPAGFYHVLPLLQKWWDIFFATVHSTLSPAMGRQDAPTVLHHVADIMLGSDSQPVEDLSYGHWDPWETYDLEQTTPLHDTIPLPHIYPSHQEHTVHHMEQSVHHAKHTMHHSHSSHIPHIVTVNHVHDTSTHNMNFPTGDVHNGDGGGGFHNFHTIKTSQHSLPTLGHNTSLDNNALQETQHNSVGHSDSILCKMDNLPSFGHKNGPTFVSSTLPEMHNTYLHKVAQDSMPHSTVNLTDPCLAMHVVNSDAPVVCARITSQGQCLIDETAGCNKVLDPSPQAGLAGAFAQLRLGAPRSEAQKALEEHLRRQNWEQGQADYMGVDSFDNIWSKICSTLSAAPGKPSKVRPSEEPTTTSKTEGVTNTEPKVATQSTEVSVTQTAGSVSAPVLQENQSNLKASDQVLEVAQPVAPASSGSSISTVALPSQSTSKPAALQTLASALPQTHSPSVTSHPPSPVIALPAVPQSPSAPAVPPSPPAPAISPPFAPAGSPAPFAPAGSPSPRAPGVSPSPHAPDVSPSPCAPAVPPSLPAPVVPPSPPVAAVPPPSPPVAAVPPLPSPITAVPPPPSPITAVLPPPSPVTAVPLPSPPVTAVQPPSPPVTAVQPPSPSVTAVLPPSPPVTAVPPSPPAPAVPPSFVSTPTSAVITPHPAPPSPTSTPAATVSKATAPVGSASSVSKSQSSKVASPPSSPGSDVDVASGTKAVAATPPGSETAVPVPPKRRGPHKATTPKDAGKPTAAAAQPAKTSKPSPKGKK